MPEMCEIEAQGVALVVQSWLVGLRAEDFEVLRGRCVRTLVGRTSTYVMKLPS